MIDHTYAKLTDASIAIVIVANNSVADLIGKFFIIPP